MTDRPLPTSAPHDADPDKVGAHLEAMDEKDRIETALRSIRRERWATYVFGAVITPLILIELPSRYPDLKGGREFTLLVGALVFCWIVVFGIDHVLRKVEREGKATSALQATPHDPPEAR